MALGLHISHDYGTMGFDYVTNDKGTKFLTDTKGNIAAYLMTKDDDWEPFDIRGEKMYIAVAMHKYRGYGPLYIPTANPQAAVVNAGLALMTKWGTVSMSHTEEQIDALFEYGGTYQTSKEMTDCWLKAYPESRDLVVDGLSRDARAARFCRGVVLHQFGSMDLPRPEVLARIWQKRAFIESIDPTVVDLRGTWGYDAAANVWGTMSLTKWYVDNGANNGYTYLWTSAFRNGAGVPLALSGSPTAYTLWYGGLMLVPVKEIPAYAFERS